MTAQLVQSRFFIGIGLLDLQTYPARGAIARIEAGFEIFNLFNKAHLSNRTFGSSEFGRISGTRFPSREIQLGARYLF